VPPRQLALNLDKLALVRGILAFDPKPGWQDDWLA
jgi:hypothetical protein